MNEQLLNLFLAMNNLLEAWEGADDVELEKLNNKYPFHVSFDELCADVSVWLESYNHSEDKLKKETPTS